MTKRISAVIHQQLYDELSKYCKENSRSMNFAITLFISNSLKERQRKRGKKEIHTEHNASN